MKFSSFSDKPYLIITQSPHGKNQNYKAMDFGHLKGNAPAKGIVKYITKPKLSRYNYFGFGNKEWETQLVHANSTKRKGGIIDRSKALWVSTWHHLHVALKVNGKWRPILDALDWDKVPVYWLKYGQKHPVWTNKNTYNLINLEPIINEQLMVNAIQTELTNLTSTNTSPLRIRLTPSTADDKNVIGVVEGDYKWQSNIYARGSLVNGNIKWWQILVPNGANKGVVGYVSASFTKEEIVDNNTDELEKEIAKLNAESTAQKVVIKKTQPVYEATILINNTK